MVVSIAMLITSIILLVTEWNPNLQRKIKWEGW
jgi:hypothetical protein